MSEQKPGSDPTSFALGQISGTVTGLEKSMNAIARDVSDLRRDVVTKDMLEKTVGPTNRFVWYIITAVFGLLIAGLASGFLGGGGRDAPDVNVIVPTAPPRATASP